MDLELRGRRALVTGSTAGIGLAVARRLAAEGAAVVVAGRNRSARPSSLLQRFATPDAVAAVIVYVCSGRAAPKNGAALRVDGGVVRSIL